MTANNLPEGNGLLSLLTGPVRRLCAHSRLLTLIVLMGASTHAVAASESEMQPSIETDQTEQLCSQIPPEKKNITVDAVSWTQRINRAVAESRILKENDLNELKVAESMVINAAKKAGTLWTLLQTALPKISQINDPNEKRAYIQTIKNQAKSIRADLAKMQQYAEEQKSRIQSLQKASQGFETGLELGRCQIAIVIQNQKEIQQYISDLLAVPEPRKKIAGMQRDLEWLYYEADIMMNYVEGIRTGLKIMQGYHKRRQGIAHAMKVAIGKIVTWVNKAEINHNVFNTFIEKGSDPTLHTTESRSI